MDDKDLKQGNGEQSEFDESRLPLLEDKEPRRKKTSYGRLLLGIFLIVTGVFLGLGYIGSVCFVSTSSSVTRPVAVENVAVSVPIAVVEDVTYTVEYANAKIEREYVNESRFTQISNGDNREISISDISKINVTAISADTIVKIVDTGENKLTISNDSSNRVSWRLVGSVLQISENVKNSEAKITIEINNAEGITVTSTSGNLDVYGNNDTTLEYLSFTTRNGDCDVKFVNAANAAFNSQSGDLEIDSSSIDTLSYSATSGDFDIRDTKSSTFSMTTSSGDFEAKDFQCFGNAEIKTSSGDVSLERIYADSLTSNSSSGYLKIKNSEINLLSTSTSSGNRSISKSYCHEIYSTSSSGDFVAENITSQRLNIISSSGKSDIKITPIEDISVDIVTSTGNIDIKFTKDISIALQCEKISKNELRLDNESGNKINIQTNSGTVKLTN